jgi:Sulfotransferase domain
MEDNTEFVDVTNFIYLAAMMKSASSLMWLVLSSIQESSNRPDPSKLDHAMTNSFLPMTVPFLKSFPRGGVFKNHAPMEYHNNFFLRQTGCKYVILIRHPADHLAAFFCHQRGVASEVRQDPERSTPWCFAAGQLPWGFEDEEPEIGIRQLIECGYLFKCLQWMADWAAFRNPEQSRLVRYEDVIGNFETVVTELCWFIRGIRPDDDLMRYVIDVFNKEIAEGARKGASQRRYPRGWTGQIGTWKNYFSAGTVEAFNSVVQKFIHAYPQAGLLSTIYPNLTI